MGRQPGFFHLDDRLRELSAKGDDLERLSALVDFETFRSELERAVPRSDRAKGGRPPYGPVLMFKILILQASHSLSDERTEYLIRDRLSFMRFPGLSLTDRVPDANSIWGFREALTRARTDDQPAIEVLFRGFDAMLQASGYIAMGGQIIGVEPLARHWSERQWRGVAAAPKQRSTEDAKRALKEGRVPEAWARKPAKLARKHRDARGTVDPPPLKWSVLKYGSWSQGGRIRCRRRDTSPRRSSPSFGRWLCSHPKARAWATRCVRLGSSR